MREPPLVMPLQRGQRIGPAVRAGPLRASARDDAAKDDGERTCERRGVGRADAEELGALQEPGVNPSATTNPIVGADCAEPKAAREKPAR